MVPERLHTVLLVDDHVRFEIRVLLLLSLSLVLLLVLLVLVLVLVLVVMLLLLLLLLLLVVVVVAVVVVVVVLLLLAAAAAAAVGKGGCARHTCVRSWRGTYGVLGGGPLGPVSECLLGRKFLCGNKAVERGTRDRRGTGQAMRCRVETGWDAWTGHSLDSFHGSFGRLPGERSFGGTPTSKPSAAIEALR